MGHVSAKEIAGHHGECCNHSDLVESETHHLHQKLDTETHCLCCESGQTLYENTVDKFIKENGFAIVCVIDSKPPFAYTVGLTEKNIPELILVGNFTTFEFNDLMMEIAKSYIKSREFGVISMVMPSLTINTPTGKIDAFIGMRRIDPKYHATMMGKALEKYGDGLRSFQVFIPDPNGNLPWSSSFDKKWGEKAMQTSLAK